MSNGQRTGAGQAKVTPLPFSVFYDANGGTGTMNADHYASGNTVKAPQNGFTAPTGKHFTGWNTAADGSGASYVAGSTFIMNAEDVTLYAQWEITPVDSVSLNKTETELALGRSETLIATVAPDGAADKSVVWTSDNPDIVTVDETGVITTVAFGTANITATATNGTETTDDDYSASCSVTVAYGINIVTVNGTVITSKSGAAQSDEEITLTVTPDAGYTLDTLTVTDADNNNVTITDNNFTMPAADVTVTAAFIPIDYMVTVSTATYGTVTVSKTDGAHVGDEIVLTVTPDTGYEFDTLTVKDVDNNDVTVTDNAFTMPASAVTVSATFKKADYSITIADNIENGTVTADKATANYGDTVALTPTPDTGCELDTLTVKDADNNDVSTTDNAFTMPASNVAVNANFKKIDYTVTIADNISNGTVTADKATANYGDTVTLTPAPDTGYELDTLAVKDAENNDVTVTDNAFTMPASAVTVSATFKKADYSITIADNIENGTVTADKATANYGDTVALTPTPDTGCELDTLTVKDADNNDVSTTDNAFTMPASNVAVNANFKKIDYTVTIADNISNGTVTADKATANYGDTVTLTASPADGYTLKSLTVTAADSSPVTVTGNTFTMPASNVTVTATFGELTTYTIFYRASGNPDSVKFRTANSGDGYGMVSSAKLGNIDCWAIQIGAAKNKAKFPAAFSTDGGSTWGALTEWNVVNDIPSDLAAGSAVAIEGEAKAFAVAFVWGENTNTDSRYYLVTTNTQSVNVPNPANTASESFKGWTYLVPSSEAGGEAEKITVNKSSSGNATTVPLDKMSQTTIVSAIWMPNSYTVNFNPDNGSAATKITVNYGNKVTPPANPTKAGYEFVGWVLAGKAVEKVGEKSLQFSAGTAFDFEKISIINNLSLKAKWRHVHAYVCLQLDNPVFGGAFADYYGYKGQLHIKLCTSVDDYSVEAHSFVNGKCACGASVLDNKVTLTEYVGSTSSATKAVKNSVVSIFAPQKQGAQVFSKWRYSADTTNGQNGTWYDLSAMRGVAFAIPANMSVKAVYEAEPFKLTINSFKYDSTHVAFQFNYSVPDGFTVVDGGLMIGDNVRMKFWDCTLNLYILGHVREPSLRNAVKVFGGGTIANNMLNYQTINQPGVATPIKKALTAFGKTGTLALAWEPYDRAGYKNAIRAGQENENYYQEKYPTYAMGYIICKNKQGGYVGFMTNAISATLENPTSSYTATIPVS